jgi:hypothetical protein
MKFYLVFQDHVIKMARQAKVCDTHGSGIPDTPELPTG